MSQGLVVTIALTTATACGDDRADTPGTLATDTTAPPAMTTTRQTGAAETGTATVYAASLEGRQTAGGEPFDHNQNIAAHRSHPMGTQLRVTNVSTNESVTVRVVDRIPQGTDAVVDLSRSAARQIGLDEQGRAEVRVEVLN